VTRIRGDHASGKSRVGASGTLTAVIRIGKKLGRTLPHCLGTSDRPHRMIGGWPASSFLCDYVIDESDWLHPVHF